MRNRKYRIYHKDSNSMEYGFDLITVSQYLNKFDDEYISKNIVITDWTGLNDKSGKEIYDGDIVHFTEFYEAGGLEGSRESDRQHKEKVYWDDVASAWCVGDFFLGVIKQQDDEIEVIGNIHENPELLTP